MLYAISDTHLSLGSHKPMDIFLNWKNHVEKLKNNWISNVKKDDTVVIAGDISWAMNFNECVKDFEFLENLPGEKILMKGNHDFWWSSLKKMKLFFLENNFKSFKILQNSSIETQNFFICGTRGWIRDPKNSQDKKILLREIERLKLSILNAKKSKLKKIAFFHYPPIYDNKIIYDFIDILLENKITKCYYGHIHSKEAIKKKFEGNYKGIEFEFIASDYLMFKPKIVC